MTFPGWIPRWVIALLDLIFGGETCAGLQCKFCGAIIDLEPGESKESWQARALANMRFFHGSEMEKL